jgi:hypothetical protein
MARLVVAHVDADREIGREAANQASFSSLVVPVLPATGLPTSLNPASAAVPRWTTPSMIEVIW